MMHRLRDRVHLLRKYDVFFYAENGVLENRTNYCFLFFETTRTIIPTTI